MKNDTPMCHVAIGGRGTKALVDSGADVSIMSKAMFDKLDPRNVFSFTKSRRPIASATGQSMKNVGEATLELRIESFKEYHSFLIVDGLNGDAMLGSDFLAKYGVKLDFEKKTLRIGKMMVQLKPQRIERHVSSLVRAKNRVYVAAQTAVECPAYVNRIEMVDQNCLIHPLDNAPTLSEDPGLVVMDVVAKPDKHRRVPVRIVNMTNHPYVIEHGQVIAYAQNLDEAEMEEMESEAVETTAAHFDDTVVNPEDPLEKVDLNHLTSEQKTQLERILRDNSDLFAQSDADLGQTPLTRLNIDTSGAAPVSQAPYKTPFSQRKYVEEQIRKMEEAGIIRQSISPWASPIVIVGKKDGSKRFCVDYRRLNKVTKANSYPLPLIEDILASLGGAKYFTSLDLRSGYWQIPMEEESIEKTAFCSFMGLREFLVMPFGVKGGPASFMSLMDKVLDGYKYKFTTAYLDDVLIYSRTFEDHLDHITKVFQRLREARLKMKAEKCEFLKSEVQYIGHVVKPDGILPNPEQVSAIRNMAPPTNAKGVRRIIGMCSFYRRFIPHFAEIVKPLTALTKKNGIFIWTDKCDEALDKLKQALTTAPLLTYPDVTQPYRLYTDASDHAIGAVLVQIQDGWRRK